MRHPRALTAAVLAGLLTLAAATAPAYARPSQPSGPSAGLGLGLGLLDGLQALADAQEADTDLLRRARVAVEGRPGQEEAPGDGAADGHAAAPTLTLADVFRAYPRLTAEQREIADGLLARPPDGARDTYGDGYSRPEADPVCGPRVCVHSVGRGPDAPPDRAWVRRTLRVMESVWTHHVDEMGFRSPAPDGGRGGDDRFDVYLADIGDQGYYGYCTPERSRPGEERRASGYCVLDNDFAEFDGRPGRTLRVTAAHEFFHAVQFDYDVGEDRWFMEATAVWMESRFAPQVRDNRQYLRFGQLGRPAVPLDAFEPTGLAHYGNWLFFERLTDRYGADVVRLLWDRLAAGSGDPDEYSTQALKRLLRARGTTLRAFLAVFAGGNLTPERAYDEGAAYEPTPLARSTSLRAGQRSGFRTRLPHLSSRSIQVRPDARDDRPRTRPRVLRIAVGTTGQGNRTAARALIHLRDGRVKARPVRLGKDGRGAVQVPFAAPRVERVTLTLVNASARYDCWEGEAYACAGVPKDDGRMFTVRARAVR